MSTTEKKDDKPIATHTTQIGSVTGQVHTGTGDINVGTFSVGGVVSTREDFLSALREFKQALEVARKEGVPEDTIDDATVEVEAVEKEVKKDTPKPDRLIKRLENVKTILIGSAGVATAATTVVTAVNKLIPLIETAIQTVNKIF